MERAFKGVWIPKEIWESRELTLQEKVLVTEIDSLDNGDGCFASNKYFAEFMKLSERQVKRMICSVIDKKWVKSKITYKKDSKEIEQRVLKVCRPPYPKKEVQDLVTDMSLGVVTKMSCPGDKNVPDNNKEEEIINNNIIDYYNNNIGLAGPRIAQILFSYIDDGIKEELIKSAIDEAVDNNARNFKYINTILTNCKNSNIHTKSQFLASQKEFREKRKQLESKNSIQKRETNEQYNNDFSEYDNFVK